MNWMASTIPTTAPAKPPSTTTRLVQRSHAGARFDPGPKRHSMGGRSSSVVTGLPTAAASQQLWRAQADQREQSTTNRYQRGCYRQRMWRTRGEWGGLGGGCLDSA
jgi:hypothetical protein